MKFSVIIPLYNKKKYIVRAVRSVLAQDWLDFELLVIDDGSTDNSLQLVRDGFRDARIRVISQPNSGEGAARNRGLNEMVGDAAAFLDADDEWLPTHLCDLAEMATIFPEASLVTTGFRAVYPDGLAVDHSIDSQCGSLIADYYRVAPLGSTMTMSSCAVSASLLERGLRFVESAPVGADLEFYVRAALDSPLAYHPRISAIYHHDVEGSVMANAVWSPDLPITAQSMYRMLCANTIPTNKRASGSTYLGWMIEQHALSGLAHGSRQEVAAFLRKVDFQAIPNRCHRRLNVLSFLVQTIPMPLLRSAVRYRRSRWHLPVAGLLVKLVALGSSSGEVRPTVRCSGTLST